MTDVRWSHDHMGCGHVINVNSLYMCVQCLRNGHVINVLPLCVHQMEIFMKSAM